MVYLRRVVVLERMPCSGLKTKGIGNHWQMDTLAWKLNHSSCQQNHSHRESRLHRKHTRRMMAELENKKTGQEERKWNRPLGERAFLNEGPNQRKKITETANDCASQVAAEIALSCSYSDADDSTNRPFCSEWTGSIPIQLNESFNFFRPVARVTLWGWLDRSCYRVLAEPHFSEKSRKQNINCKTIL